jgi:DNA damage-binding protein 1
LTSPDISSDIPLEAKQIFFTSSGRIGVVVDITDDQLSLHLTALQRNMANISKGAGGTSHAR